MPISWSEYGEEETMGDHEVSCYIVGYDYCIYLDEATSRFDLYFPEEIRVKMTMGC